MKYRPEIDGLRAVAIVPVVLFHAGLPIFSGGFVGVDVFFVISGYLIGRLIFQEMEIGSFSLRSFYERRARRILPALFFVICACIPFAYLWMLPLELKAFSTSILSVILFSSNFLFYRQSDYFDQTAELKPLLHTWSLSVEEQFYIVFPVLMLILYRFFRRGIGLVLILAFLASFALAQLGGNIKFGDPDFVWSWESPLPWGFYYLPTRAWEMLLGVLIAHHHHHNDVSAPAPGYGLIRECAGLTGLLLILFAIFFYDRNTPFPSVYTLAPTIGAALIIGFAQQGTLAGRTLSNKLLVSIGLISYSFYLWHQPLFAFARIRSIDEPSASLLLALAALAAGLAYLTWRFVEQPFRDRKRWGTKRFILSLVPALVLMSAFGIAGHLTWGFPLRDARLASIEARMSPNYGLGASCNFRHGPILPEYCGTGRVPKALLWGDSFAMHLVQAIKAANPHLSFSQAAMLFCGPLLGIAPLNGERHNKAWAGECLLFNRSILAYLAREPSIKIVVLSSILSQYTESQARILVDDKEVSGELNQTVSALKETVRAIESLGKKVVIFSPPPVTGKEIGHCLARATMLGASISVCDFSLAQANLAQAKALEALRAMEVAGTEVRWLRDEMCSASICRASGENIFIYRDDRHLSIEGSDYLGRSSRFFHIPVTEPVSPARH